MQTFITNCLTEKIFFTNTLKTFDDFKNKQQKCMKLCFLIGKSINILKVFSIHCTLRYNTNVKTIFSRQDKGYIKCISFPSSNSPQYTTFN